MAVQSKEQIFDPRSPSTSSSSSNSRQNDGDAGPSNSSNSERDLNPQEVEKLVQLQDVTGIDDLQAGRSEYSGRPSD